MAYLNPVRHITFDAGDPQALARFWSQLTGYSLGSSQFRTSPQPCSGSARCISGYFVRYVDASDRFTYTNTGPDLGADILRLVR